MKKIFFIVGLNIVLLPLVSQNLKVSDVPVEKLLNRVESPSDTIFVVNFWATWCQPCVTEIPEFNKIEPHYKNKPVVVIMASLDFPNQKDKRLIPFLKTNIILNSVYLLITPRGGDWISRVEKQWTGAIPFTLILHKKKRIFHEGEINYETIKKYLAQINP